MRDRREFHIDTPSTPDPPTLKTVGFQYFPPRGCTRSSPVVNSWCIEKTVCKYTGFSNTAGSTGLEPATSAVTGQRSNQLSYDPKRRCIRKARFHSTSECRGRKLRLRPRTFLFGSSKRAHNSSKFYPKRKSRAVGSNHTLGNFSSGRLALLGLAVPLVLPNDLSTNRLDPRQSLLGLAGLTHFARNVREHVRSIEAGPASDLARQLHGLTVPLTEAIRPTLSRRRLQLEGRRRAVDERIGASAGHDPNQLDLPSLSQLGLERGVHRRDDEDAVVQSSLGAVESRVVESDRLRKILVVHVSSSGVCQNVCARCAVNVQVQYISYTIFDILSSTFYKAKTAL